MKKERWVVSAKRADFQAIADRFGIDPVIARLIRNRDVTGEKEIEEYLFGDLEQLHDPLLMKDMERAADLIAEKIREKKPIRIIGDYDIDGVTATYILLTGLKDLGADVDVRIPDRIADGYGLNEHLVQFAADEGRDTIVTCDNGIAASSQIRLAKELGMTVVVTDHHEVPFEEDENGERRYILPPADAVVNPKQKDCSYPFPGLCGAAVAWKLIQTMEAKAGIPKEHSYRFLEFVEDILPQLSKEREQTIIDFGCGKSYLTFAMYYYLRELKGYDVNIIGLDLKTDVIEKCNHLAVKYGYEKLHFYQGDIADYEGVSSVDMVVTLHACDTATDYALAKAVEWGAKVILSVPCCQHEVNRQIKNEVLEPVLKYGILKERMAALMTDGIRANLLESMGYETQILEFIDMEHTPKNLLIRAVKTGKPKDMKSTVQLMKELHINPTLEILLYREGEVQSES